MRALVLSILGLMACGAAAAHDGRPVLVRITGPETARIVEWQAPPVLPAGAEPRLVLEGCDTALAPLHGLIGRGVYDCSQTPSPSLRIDWPTLNPALSTLVQSEAGTQFYGPEIRAISLAPASDQAGADFASFVTTGIDHIVNGYDHLLFILAMTLIVVLNRTARLADTARRLGWLVTGFTLSHSLTLILSAFDVIVLPIPAVEAAIALSILFVCAELARPARDTLTWRHPALTASAFGLLHGLGFASVLSDAGLTAEHRVVGLVGFNLGVEIGQLAFVFAVCLVLAAGQAALPVLWRKDTLGALAYGMGGLSAYWTLDRVLAF